MKLLHKNLILIAILSTTVFILTTSFGLNMSMGMDNSGHMTNCPLMNDKGSICPMTLTDHLAKWQQLFTINTSSALMMILSMLAVTSIYFLVKSNAAVNQSTLFLYRYQKQRQREAKLFNPLQLAFSNGILHPKRYK